MFIKKAHLKQCSLMYLKSHVKPEERSQPSFVRDLTLALFSAAAVKGILKTYQSLLILTIFSLKIVPL